MVLDSIEINGKRIHLETPKEAIEMIKHMDTVIDYTLLKPGAGSIIAANQERVKRAEEAVKDMIVASFELMDHHPGEYKILETIQESLIEPHGSRWKPEVLLLFKRVVVGAWDGHEGAFTARIDMMLRNKVTFATLRGIGLIGGG
jgi:hypothetical protein